MSLSKKETENILFDLVDQIHSAAINTKMGIDRRQLVMTLISHNTNPKSDDVSIGSLLVMCEFVISAFQLGYFPEIYEKMQSNKNELREAIENINLDIIKSRGQTK